MRGSAPMLYDLGDLTRVKMPAEMPAEMPAAAASTNRTAELSTKPRAGDLSVAKETKYMDDREKVSLDEISLTEASLSLDSGAQVMDSQPVAQSTRTNIAVGVTYGVIGAVLMALIVVLTVRQARIWSTRYQLEQEAQAQADLTPVAISYSLEDAASCQDNTSTNDNETIYM